ncbi:hypothetical protein B0A52_01852 [Exophiala mesophila]|uniref:BHLH domain-containing protein n=1 Tax=Exophiala mesophila TaxID=212818 RepID=A0A438NE65_EXOME|nr:hypothetical protein B0A52_01852 [Exophiala mesophila]
MPYSKSYQNYPGTVYNTQAPWDEVDYTNLQPAIADYSSSPKHTDYSRFHAADTSCQDVGSPGFEQFLNLDCSDVGSFSVPSDNFSPEPIYKTSPTSLDFSQQSTLSSLKLEPGSVPNAGFGCPAYQVLSPDHDIQLGGLEPACFQSASLGEIEDCSAAHCITPTMSNSSSRKSPKSTTSRKPSKDTARSPKQIKERDQKSRSKRTHTASESEDESAQLRAKQAHSVVERRYRDNLNGKIMQLHRALVTSDAFARSTSGLSNHDFYASREHRGKVRKSDVMTDAMNYVHQSEVEMRHMTNEITRLTDRVMALEKLVKCEDCTLLKQMVRLQLQRQATQ